MGKSSERKPERDINTWIGSGRLVCNPDRRGKVVVFRIATHRIEYVQGVAYEVPSFLPVTVLGSRQGDLCMQYLKMGRRVLVKASSLAVDKYELKKDGEIVFWDEREERPIMMPAPTILTNDVEFLSGAVHKPERDINTWIGSGRLVCNPDRRGKVVVFSIATHRIEYVQGVAYEVPSFLPVTVLGSRQGDLCMQYLKMGRKILIRDGSLHVDEDELKKDGEIVFWDEREERPIMRREPSILTRNIQFL